MIGDLKDYHFQQTATDVDFPEEVTVLYYFFDRQRRHESTSHAALSALLTQALQSHQHRFEFLDLACLLMTAPSSGQRFASTVDIQTLLSTFLQRYPGTVIVLDAIDECADVEALLETLHKIIGCSQCQIAMTGRPTVDTWLLYRDSHIPPMSPLNEENARDIRKLVGTEMNHLFERRFFGDCTIARVDLEQRIADRANSMILWVALLFSYLKSPALSIPDRLDAVDNLQLLDSLDEMYTKILDHLRVRFAGRAWKNVWNGFGLVAVAQRPYTPTELETALACRSGQLADNGHTFVEIERTIHQMSGALIEISKNNHVRFIHASVLEYLIGEDDGSGHDDVLKASTHRIDTVATNMDSAIMCLKYSPSCDARTTQWVVANSSTKSCCALAIPFIGLLGGVLARSSESGLDNRKPCTIVN